MSQRFRFPLFAALASLWIGTGAQSATESFTGNLSGTNGVQHFEFVTNGGVFTATTFSYSGGINDDGLDIAAGGFDPYVWLFDGTGAYQNEDDDSRGFLDPASLSEYDAMLTTTLDAGTYTLTLARYGTFSYGDLSDGFGYSGPESFLRTTFWAVDLSGIVSAEMTGGVTAIEASPVPIPAALPLLIGGLFMMRLLRRR